MRVYKLTDQNAQTRGGYQWAIGEHRETSGEGSLCSDGYLHWYHDPLLAVLLNPVHAAIDAPRMFIAEAGGVIKDDRGLKGGSSVLTLVREMDVPHVTKVQRVAFGILCAMEVCEDRAWWRWAEQWLTGNDRSVKRAELAMWVEWMAARSAVKAVVYPDQVEERSAKAAEWSVWAAHREGMRIDLPALSRKAMEVV